jgi:hypothetical protein
MEEQDPSDIELRSDELKAKAGKNYASVPVADFPSWRVSSTLRRSSDGRKGFSRRLAPDLTSSFNSGN